MINNAELKRAGRACYSSNKVNAIVAALLVPAAMSVNAIFKGEYISSLVSLLVLVFLTGPLQVGAARFFLFNREDGGNGQTSFEEVFFAFRDKDRYLHIVSVMFAVNVRIFLFGLLLVIPGVIKAYQYRLVPYMLAIDPTVSEKDALDESTARMDGFKMGTFMLDFSFIGWLILSLFTAGILYILYVNPWMGCTQAELAMLLLSDNGPHRGRYAG